jgi:hypothetical protein
MWVMPSVETPGYCQPSLRDDDVETLGIKSRKGQDKYDRAGAAGNRASLFR